MNPDLRRLVGRCEELLADVRLAARTAPTSRQRVMLRAAARSLARALRILRRHEPA